MIRLLVDTGFLVALYIRGDTLHQASTCISTAKSATATNGITGYRGNMLFSGRAWKSRTIELDCAWRDGGRGYPCHQLPGSGKLY